MRASYDTTPQSLSHLASPGLYTPPVGRGEGGGGLYNPPVGRVRVRNATTCPEEEMVYIYIYTHTHTHRGEST